IEMASGAIFSSLRRRRSPTLEAFLAPVDLSDVALVQTLVTVVNELVSCFSKRSFFFQRKNTRSLVRKIENHSISGHFHDLNQEISTLLDVFPVKDVGLSKDVREQVELLLKQSRRAKLFIDMEDDALRIRFFSFLDEFENGRIPDSAELRSFYVDKLKVIDAASCRTEIEALEEQIVNHEGDIEPTISVLKGFVAMTRYCRFLIFGFEEDELDLENG
ncbi:U-box domain-containing protein 17-like, partial [Trifolium medium]|nr:U-box domain-containing protein 17-like [Trifolium medium]